MEKEKKYLYMEVTADKYELPVRVADSGAELAKMSGIDPHTVYKDVSRNGTGRNRGTKYVKVRCDPENEDEA